MTLKIDASIRACTAVPQGGHIRFRATAGQARPGSIRSDQERASLVRKPISCRVYLCRRLCSIPHSAKPSRP